jgi:hypothetical protein
MKKNKIKIIGYDEVDWIYLAQGQWQVVLNTPMNLRIP